jgi:beta-glucosidase
VLLKNDGALPLQKGSRVCLFGIGAGEFLFGGGGSAEVFPDREITLAQGLQAAADRGDIAFFPDTVEFYVNQTEAIQRADFETQTAGPVVWRRNFHMPLIDLPEELYQRAVAFGDTAIFCVSRFSSEGDDSGDRNGQKGDFYLWDNEQKLLERLYKDFHKVVVVINSCGPVSTREYGQADAILYPLYGGGIAGEALTDILVGKAYPSGHLQHTLAYDLGDYPTTAGFHAEKDYVNYTEDIFVGYRYFETFAPEKVAYPFGFGLSYTTFAVTTTAAVLEKNTVKLEVSVENTGKTPGKEVVQAYLSAPQGILGKAAKVLTAFAKTREL